MLTWYSSDVFIGNPKGSPCVSSQGLKPKAHSTFFLRAMFARASLLLGLAAAADVSLRGSLASGDCKTVSPLAELNITEYLRATWYSQQQQLTSYQPASELFCVSATYNDEPDRTVPFFDGFVASAYNYATRQNVSGEPANTKDGMVLCARQQDPKVQGGLSVAPCFLPNVFTGPYDVVGVGVAADGVKYDWVIVSGGQPSEKQADGLCTTKTGTYFGGLWLFTRETVASDATVAAARAKMADLGISTSQLVDVPQAGCTYDGAFIKPNS